MKKIYNHFYLTLCAVLAFAMGACTEETEYIPAEAPAGAQVYFPSTLPTQLDLDINATSFDIQVSRAATDAATVNLAVTNESGLFTIPTSVNFGAGEQVTNLTITYDPTTLEYDDYKSITIAVADESNKTPYGTSSYTFKAGIPSPWTSLGKATYSDAFMYEGSFGVEIQQNDLDKNLFRLIEPYVEGANFEFRILQPGDDVKGTTVTMNDLIYYGDIDLGYHIADYDDDVILLHPSRFTSMAAESAWAYNKVVSYQENGLPAVIQIAPMYYMFNYGGGWNYTTNPSIQIVFPGVVLKDYTAKVTYLGRLVGVDESNKVMANITLGEDVTSAKYAMAADVNPSALAQAIIDGSVESVTIEASGDIQIPVEEDGDYTIVVVTYDGEEAQEMASASFEITLGASEWESIGMAQYTDDILAPLYGAPVPTYEVEVLASNKTPGMYRLVNPYGADYPYNEEGDYDASRKYYMEINATDPEGVYIELQDTGLNWGDGNLYVYSMAAYYMDNGYTFESIKGAGYCGTLVDGVITFPVEQLLCMLGTDGPYYANTNGEFKIVLPTATSAAAVTSSRVASRSASTFTKQFNKNNKVVKNLPNNRYFSTITIAE